MLYIQLMVHLHHLLMVRIPLMVEQVKLYIQLTLLLSHWMAIDLPIINGDFL